MTLQENIASDRRQPGTFATFDDTSGSRGTSPTPRRLLICAMKTSAAPAATEVPVQVFSEAEARSLFGVGSEAALMVEWAYKTWRKLAVQRAGSGSAQVWVIPIADPAGTAAIHRFAVTGTATEGGDLVVYVAGRRIVVPVASGDAANPTVAAALAAKIGESVNSLPVTASSTLGNCDVTAVNTGTNGSRIIIGVDQATVPAGLTVTPTQDQTAGVGTASIVNALDATLGILGTGYSAIAIANHVAQDVTDLGSHMDIAWDPKTQKFRHAHIGVNNTLGTATTLASGGNRKEIVVTTCENCPNTPGEMAVVTAAINLSQERPAYNHNRTETPLFPPQDAADHYLDSEVETALDGGTSPLTVTAEGRTLLERMFTTKTTVNGAAFENLRPLKTSKTGAVVAQAIDARLKLTQLAANLDTDQLRLYRAEALSILRQFETLGDLHKVDDHIEELRSAVSAAVVDRALLEVPYSVLPDANQVDATYRLFFEGADA